MKIILISGSGPPEPGTAARVHWDLASHLAGEGNNVWLINPKPSRPLGTRYPEIRGNKVKMVNEYFHHVIIDSYTCPACSFLGRCLESFDFGLRSTRFVNKRIKEYDAIYASPWAFLGHLMILLLRANRKSAFIMNVQDLYPESFFLKIKFKPLVWFFKPLCLVDRYIAGRSDHLTVISESLKQFYVTRRKIPESKISVIHNWQDSGVFLQKLIPVQAIREKYNLSETKGKFVFMFLGNIGPVAGVENLISSFSILDINDTFLVIAGSGSSKEKCQQLAKRCNCSNISFTSVPEGLVPVAELQSLADVLLLPINRDAAFSSVPSKLIAYMFSRKAIICSADEHSETGSVIVRSGCGWLIGSTEPDSWKKAMQNACHTDRAELSRMGELGFKHAFDWYSRESSLKRYSNLFDGFQIR